MKVWKMLCTSWPIADGLLVGETITTDYKFDRIGLPKPIGKFQCLPFPQIPEGDIGPPWPEYYGKRMDVGEIAEEVQFADMPVEIEVAEEDIIEVQNGLIWATKGIITNFVPRQDWMRRGDGSALWGYHFACGCDRQYHRHTESLTHQDPRLCHFYADHFNRGDDFGETAEAIAEDPHWSFHHGMLQVKQGFHPHEVREGASRHPAYALMFAAFVDKGTHEETKKGADKHPLTKLLYEELVEKNDLENLPPLCESWGGGNKPSLKHALMGLFGSSAHHNMFPPPPAPDHAKIYAEMDKIFGRLQIKGKTE